MIGLITFAMIAAVSAQPAPMPHMAVTVSARASARIVSAARISLSAAPQPEGYAVRPAVVTAEDGTQRDAQLVEFQ
jgi:hypothetical protein